MKNQFPARLMAAMGLIIISASFFVRHYTQMPDFADGLMKGIGIGMIVVALIKQTRLKRKESI